MPGAPEFVLRLDEIETGWLRGHPAPGEGNRWPFVDGRIERMLARTATAGALEGHRGRPVHVPDLRMGSPGVEPAGPEAWRLTVRLWSGSSNRIITFTPHLSATPAQGHLVFSLLWNRFLAGENHAERAAKVSDSERIRHALQTCARMRWNFRGTSIAGYFVTASVRS